MNTPMTAPSIREALEALVNAKALKGVRELVAGWNGEGRDEPYKERHPSRLGATLPKTNCGAVYELDEAMQNARAALSAPPQDVVEGIEEMPPEDAGASHNCDEREPPVMPASSSGGAELRVRARLAWNNWPDSDESRRIIANHEARDKYSADAWDRVIAAILASGLVTVTHPDESAIRADERERCAKIADDRWREWRSSYEDDLDGMDTCNDIAAAIRVGGAK